MLLNSSEYLNTVESIKQEIRAAQYRASVSVNRELLLLYHTIAIRSMHIRPGAANSLKVFLPISNLLFRTLPVIPFGT